jgi:hypothetical protein
MRGKKKKSIEDLEMELEQLMANSGRSKDDIHTDYNAYLTLKWRIDNPNSCHDDDDILRMKDLHDVFLLGMTIRRRQKKINAALKVAAAAAAATAATTAAAITTSNVANTSIISSYATSMDSSASTLINRNEITASFESTPPSLDPSSTSSLPSSNDETRASLDINSLSNQSSILALHSINEITASFEANASFALSTSHSNASNSSIVGGAQPSKRPRLASQQSDAVVDLSNECSIWRPHQQLLSGNVSIMDVPGDGNCLFYACISQLQNCTTFTIEQASIMRNILMDYLLLHADNLSGNSMSLTWRTLVMMHASKIQSELRHKGFF